MGGRTRPTRAIGEALDATSGMDHQEPPTLTIAAAELASIVDAGEPMLAIYGDRVQHNLLADSGFDDQT
jgi:hypothetical protein